MVDSEPGKLIFFPAKTKTKIMRWYSGCLNILDLDAREIQNLFCTELIRTTKIEKENVLQIVFFAGFTCYVAFPRKNNHTDDKQGRDP